MLPSAFKIKEIITEGDIEIIEYEDGFVFYHKNGVCHRDDDKPAIVKNRDNDHRVWYKNGKIHRENNFALIIKTSSGKIHRKEWILHGNKYGYREYWSRLLLSEY